MSYIKKEEWTILPGEAPAIRRNCSGCRKSSIFRSSGNFRMNANGNKLDVWLIYRCEKCDTSWNMDIYTRTAPGMLGQDLYNRFLENDADTALEFGCRKEILSRNKAEALWGQVPFMVEKTFHEAKDAGETLDYAERMISAENTVLVERIVSVERILSIHNPYEIPMRLDKLLCRELNCSRKDVACLEDSGGLYIRTGGKDSRSRIPIYMEAEIREPFPRG